MAAEAVFKIKEAEDNAKEIVKKANEEARQVLAQAKEACDAQRSSTLEKAQAQREAMIREAVEKANLQCEQIASDGAAERAKILAPDKNKLEGAIQLVMERIVSV